MRRVILCLLFVCFLTGCNKSTKCSYDYSNSAMSIKKNYKVIYNKNKIVRVNAVTSYLINDDIVNATFDSMIISMKSNLESNGLDYKYENDEKKHVFDVIYDIKSMSEDAFNYYVGTDDYGLYREKLLNQGFKCK